MSLFKCKYFTIACIQYSYEIYTNILLHIMELRSINIIIEFDKRCIKNNIELNEYLKEIASNITLFFYCVCRVC